MTDNDSAMCIEGKARTFWDSDPFMIREVESLSKASSYKAGLEEALNKK